MTTGHKGLEGLQRGLLKEITPYFRRYSAEQWAKLWTGRTEDLTHPRATPREEYFLEIFGRFWEIGWSLQSLSHIPLYLRVFPKYQTWTRAGITQTEYLRYHVDHYLEENYILKERVKAFLQFVEGVFRSEGKGADADSVGRARRLFLEGTRNLLNVRRIHVHQRRYRDDEIDMVILLETVGRGDVGIQKGASLGRSLIKSRWLRTMRENNRALTSFLDSVCDAVYPLIFGDAPKG